MRKLGMLLADLLGGHRLPVVFDGQVLHADAVPFDARPTAADASRPGDVGVGALAAHGHDPWASLPMILSPRARRHNWAAEQGIMTPSLPSSTR